MFYPYSFHTRTILSITQQAGIREGVRRSAALYKIREPKIELMKFSPKP
jgi:hypothetical protein